MRNMKAPDVGADTEYQRAGSPLAQVNTSYISSKMSFA